MAGKQEALPAHDDADVMKAIHHWTDERLDIELVFAEAGVVETWPETIVWRDAVIAEAARRTAAGEPPA
jgi:hypothetical protein